MTAVAVAQPITVEHLVAPGALARKAMARVGESVAKFLKRNRWRFDLDTILVINGKPVLRRDDGWKLRRFQPGDVVRFVSRPFGGQQGKQIGGLIALIALTVFATWAVGPAGLGLTGLVATATKAVIVAGGMLLYNTLVYPKPGNRSADDSLYSFNASGNTARPLETIPLPYGRLQRDLDYAALPYKTYQGTDEYFNGLFMLGNGRFSHEALLVDDIEFWNAERAAADGTGTGSAGTIPAGVQSWVDAAGNRPSSPGVVPPFDGIQVEFVEPGQPVTLFPTNVHQSPEVNGLEFGSPSSPGGGWSPWFAVCNPGAVTSLIHLDIALPNGFVRNNHETEASYRVEIQQINDAGTGIGPVMASETTYRGFYRKPHRFTHSFPQAVAARYALRFRRVDEPLDPSRGATDFYAAGLRAEIPGQTVFPEGTMVAIRIKATKQLSDYSSRRIRYRGTRVLPVWTGTAWETQATRNPIWAAIDFRTNPDYGGRLPLSRLQLDDWIVEAAAADARGDTFDFEFKNAVKVGEGLDTILAAARSKHRWYGHILSLVRDQWTDTPRMLITDREMVAGSFSLTANFRDANAPDGLILNYIDETTWRPAQVIVPIGATPTNPVTEEARGITRRAHATREAVFKWNAQVKRRIGPSFSMLLDGHILGYGDHVEIQSRTPQDWGAAHAVIGHSGDVVRLPRAPQWPDGVTMYAAIRTKSGGLFGPCRVSQGETPRDVVFNGADLAAILTASGQTLADALDRAPDAAPPTLALGPAFDFLRRMQVVSVEPRGDKAQVAGFLDFAEVHDPDEVDEAPRPPDLVFPAKGVPRVTGLSGRLEQVLFETRLIAAWNPSPNATHYTVEGLFEEASVYVKFYEGPLTSIDVVCDNTSLTLRVTPVGDRGAGLSASVFVPAVGIGLPIDIGLDHLDKQVQAILDQVRTRAENTVRAALEELADRVERLAEAQVSTDASSLDQVEVLKVATESGFAAIAQERSARIEGDLAQAEVSTALAVQLNDVETGLAGTSAALSGLTTTVDAQGDQITSTSAAVTALQSGLASATDQINATATAVGSLSTTVSSQGGQISSISSSVTGLQSSFTSLNGTVTANSFALETLQTDVTSLDETVTATAASISALTSQYNGISASGAVEMVTAAAPSGYTASYEVRLTAATTRASFRMLVSNTGVAGIDLFAARTRFLGNDGTPFAVFNADTRQLLLERVPVISSDQLGLNSATRVSSATAVTIFDSFGITTETALCTLSFTVTVAATVTIIATSSANSGDGSNAVIFRLNFPGGNVARAVGRQGSPGTIVWSGFFSPGTYTATLTAQGAGGSGSYRYDTHGIVAIQSIR